jgi:hypothetical protein
MQIFPAPHKINVDLQLRLQLIFLILLVVLPSFKKHSCKQRVLGATYKYLVPFLCRTSNDPTMPNNDDFKQMFFNLRLSELRIRVWIEHFSGSAKNKWGFATLVATNISYLLLVIFSFKKTQQL